MLNTNGIGRTYGQALTGSKVALAIPRSDVDAVELILRGSAAWSFAFNTTDTVFDVGANDYITLRVQRDAYPLVTGSGTLKICVLGGGGRTSWPT